MTAANFTFRCLTCKRDLGTPDELPESCPRCGTPLSSLREILGAAINSYRRGCLAVRDGNYAQAIKAFDEAASLWNTDHFQQAKFFTQLLAQMSDNAGTFAEKIIRQL